MASIQRVSVLSGFAAAAVLVGALPGQASELTITAKAFDADASVANQSLANQSLTLDDLSSASFEGVQFANQTLGLDATVTTEQPVTEQPVTEQPVVEDAEGVENPAAIAQPDADTVEVEAETAEAETLADTFAQEEAVATSAALLLQPDATLALVETPNTDSEAANNPEAIAQATAPLYRGISPVYLGVGGNVGIIDSDQSGVGDFAFAIFGKVSLGPRFAVRPALFVSEDDTSLTIPLTFNFNPIQISGFTVAPFVGGGIDISGDAGALVNAGVDIPISRQFTMTAQGNLRVTDDTGLGLLLGVAYNIPLFFE